jgi:nucleoid DNA-binding protein
MAKTAPEVGREVVTAQVRIALNLSSDREADNVVKVVLEAIIATIHSNIDTDGFALKLPSFGKFKVRHTKGKMRKIPLTGKTQMTADKRKVKFVALSDLRQLERMPEQRIPEQKKGRK